MKTAFIVSATDGCAYVRGYLHYKYFTGKKYCNWTELDYSKTPVDEKPNLFNLLKAGDVCIFHRVHHESVIKVMLKLQENGVIVGYDNDDTYKGMDKGNPFAEQFKKHPEYVANNYKAVTLADFVTTTNPFLAQEFLEYNKRVFVLLNQIDPSLYNPVIDPQKKIRVLLLGSNLWAETTDSFFPVIKKIIKDPKYQLVAFGSIDKDFLDRNKYKLAPSTEKMVKFWELHKDKVEIHYSVPIFQYAEKLSSLNCDVVIIPRKDNYFNKCKSNIKYLECSSAGILTIAQGFKDGSSPYQGGVMTYNDPMFIAYEDKDFMTFLEKIASKTPEERKSLRQFVKKHVDSIYNAQNNAFESALKYIVDAVKKEKKHKEKERLHKKK